MIVPIPPVLYDNTTLAWEKYCKAMNYGTGIQKTISRNILYVWLNECNKLSDKPLVSNSEYTDPPVHPQVETENGANYGTATGNLVYLE